MPAPTGITTAIVTGASRNVGREVACRFAADGARVALAGRDLEGLEETARRIRDVGGSDPLVIPTDVTDFEQVERLISRTLDAFGEIDVLAAIAGGACVYEPIDEMEPDAWDQVFRTNVTSAFYCVRSVLPHFRSRNRGTILLCSGGGSYYPVLGQTMAAYACAKAAICRLTDQLTAELWETDIRVHAIDPGLAWDDARRAEVEAEERRTGKPHPQRPQFRPASESATLAAWAASDASRPLRGRCLSVYDGWCDKSPEDILQVHATINRYRVRRDDL